MYIKRLYMENSYRNYNYLVICEKTKDALLIDPYDASKCLDAAKKLSVTIKAVINTHEHWDHIQGNKEIVEATGAQVFAHPKAVNLIEHANALELGSEVNIGKEICFQVIDTPGHTMGHISLLNRKGEPVVFSGDTLFSAGVGHCHKGGNPKTLYQTITSILYNLPDDTKVYAGHDYIENNLNFALSRETNNGAAKNLLKRVRQQTPLTRHVTTIGEEKLINPFFRLESASVIDQLRVEGTLRNNNPESVFTSLRATRDKW